MANTTGVFPCWENQFSIDVTGGDGKTEDNLKNIADMESFTVSIEGNIEEWNPYDQEGWGRALMTGKKLKISVSGKRSVGDEGNDYVAGKAFATGQDCNSTVCWNFPSGARCLIPCVINVTECSSGETTNVGPLSYEIISDGKPDFTPAA